MPEIIVDERNFFSEVECVALKDILEAIVTAKGRMSDEKLRKYIITNLEETNAVELRDVMPHVWENLIKEETNKYLRNQERIQKMSARMLEKLPALVKQFHGIDI